jgi:hypothetical protein
VPCSYLILFYIGCWVKYGCCGEYVARNGLFGERGSCWSWRASLRSPSSSLSTCHTNEEVRLRCVPASIVAMGLTLFVCQCGARLLISVELCSGRTWPQSRHDPIIYVRVLFCSAADARSDTAPLELHVHVSAVVAIADAPTFTDIPVLSQDTCTLPAPCSLPCLCTRAVSLLYYSFAVQRASCARA